MERKSSWDSTLADCPHSIHTVWSTPWCSEYWTCSVERRVHMHLTAGVNAKLLLSLLPFHTSVCSPFLLRRTKWTHSSGVSLSALTPGLHPHHIASLFIPSLQTLSKLISKSWEHLIVLINPMPGEIWFCASEASRLFWIDSLFWLMPAFPI